MHAEQLSEDQSKTCLLNGVPPSTHLRPNFRANRVLYCILFDSQGIVASICVPKNLTVKGQDLAEQCIGEVQNHDIIYPIIAF